MDTVPFAGAPQPPGGALHRAAHAPGAHAVRRGVGHGSGARDFGLGLGGGGGLR